MNPAVPMVLEWQGDAYLVRDQHAYKLLPTNDGFALDEAHALLRVRWHDWRHPNLRPVNEALAGVLESEYQRQRGNP